MQHMEQIKNQVISAHLFRHACKQFDSFREIADEDFRFILETGRLSPSSFGFEPWQFVVLQNRELRAKLLPVSWGAQKQLTTSSHLVLMLTRTRDSLLADAAYIQQVMSDVQQLPESVVAGKRDKYRAFLETDFKLDGNERAIFEWASRQTYIALGNMMTAAAMIGVDSCPIEGFDKEAAERILREEQLLADDLGLSCMVAFGYRVQPPRRKTRRNLEEVVRWVE